MSRTIGAVSALPVDRLLVGITGTLGIYDFLYYVEAFRGTVAKEIRVIHTPTASRFIDPQIVSMIVGCEVWTDFWDERDGVRVPHAELPEWAQMFIVIPATVNTLSLVARGDASGLLHASVLGSPRPVGFVPNMKQSLWRAPATRRNVAQMREDGHLVMDLDEGEYFLQPVDKSLPPDPAPSPEQIAAFVLELARASGIEAGEDELHLAPAAEAIERIDRVRRTFGQA